MSNWYVLKSKPNKEEFLAGQLQARNFNVYLPQFRVKPVNPRSRKVRSVFPGYLFVQASDGFSYSDVQWLPGSQGMVHFDNVPAQISDGDIAGIRTKVNLVNQAETQARSGFQSQDKVIVVEGIFSGYEALFDSHISGTDRVRVLLQFIKARQVPVELSESALRKKK